MCQELVELRRLGLASILLCSMLVGLLEYLESVGGVKRVSSKLVGLPFQMETMLVKSLPSRNLP
jgi:hypothetical protein